MLDTQPNHAELNDIATFYIKIQPPSPQLSLVGCVCEVPPSRRSALAAAVARLLAQPQPSADMTFSVAHQARGGERIMAMSFFFISLYFSIGYKFL